MKRIMLKGISLGLVISLMYSFIALAATPRGEALTSVNQISQLLPEGMTESNSRQQPGTKGIVLSDSIISISNQGDGAIGVVAMSTFHQPAERGMLIVSLDRLDTDGNWLCVEVYEFEFRRENEADGELTSMTVGFLATDQPAGHYYRLRGIHEVEFFDEKGKLNWEGMSSFTDGIKITK